MKKEKLWAGMTTHGCIRHRHVCWRMIRNAAGRVVRCVSLRPGVGVLWERR